MSKKEKKTKSLKERVEILETFMKESAGVLQLHHQFIQVQITQADQMLRHLGVLPPLEEPAKEESDGSDS